MLSSSWSTSVCPGQPTRPQPARVIGVRALRRAAGTNVVEVQRPRPVRVEQEAAHWCLISAGPRALDGPGSRPAPRTRQPRR